MKSIVFLGTNKTGSSYEGIKAAKRLGYHIILLTNRCLFLEDKHEFPEIDEVHLTNLSNIEELFSLITELVTDGKVITCFISFLDEFIFLAAMLTNSLCQSFITVDSFEIMTDKIETRRFLANKKYSPFFTVLNSLDMVDEAGIALKDRFPLILKAPRSNGSKDVVLVENIRDFKKGVKRIHCNHPNHPILIEEYLQGPQYLVEVVVFNGKIIIPAVIEQDVTLNESFIITGYSLRPTMTIEDFPGLGETVESIISDLQFKYGTCHLELRLTQEGWMLIEINPRMAGGAMNRMIEEAYGYNLAEQTIRLYLGEEPQFIKNKEMCIYTHYLMADSIGKLLKVSGCELAKKSSGIVEVYTKGKTGKIVMPPRSMGQRCGYILAAAAESTKQAKEMAIQAAGQIKFYLQPL